ncbi:MAG: hypothetical protein ACRDJY_02925 [Thermoleophilaceae bacterium]
MPPADHTDAVAAPYPGGPIRRAIFAHLASRQVSRVIYGAIIGLALIVALETHSPGIGSVIATLLGTAMAVALAELYSEVIGFEAVGRRKASRTELPHLAGDIVAVVFGVAFPVVFFLLAAIGVFEEDTAFEVAKWAGLGLIGLYGFAGARLSGNGRFNSLLKGTGVALIGAVLIGLKALVH